MKTFHLLLMVLSRKWHWSLIIFPTGNICKRQYKNLQTKTHLAERYPSHLSLDTLEWVRTWKGKILFIYVPDILGRVSILVLIKFHGPSPKKRKCVHYKNNAFWLYNKENDRAICLSFWGCSVKICWIYRCITTLYGFLTHLFCQVPYTTLLPVFQQNSFFYVT